MKTPKYKINLLTLILLALTFSITPSFSAEIKFNIGRNAYPPYIVVENKKVTEGIVIDILSQIAKKNGHTVSFFQTSRKTIDVSLKETETDATAKMHNWQPKDSDYISTDSLFSMKNIFFYLKEKALKFERLEDLYGKKFKTHIGFNYPELEALMKKGLIRRYDEYTEFEMLEKLFETNGKFDGTILDERVGLWIIQNNKLKDKFDFSTKSLGEYEYKIMFHNKWKEFVPLFNEELLKMKNNGEISKIIKKYIKK
ncbi:MAG: transporter substrate-binding domain-containing protein [Campylobacteraceae bacterium]|nr:transporter substrate-binding domain-containing protein [Campylobacteraceae bacterium]